MVIFGINPTLEALRARAANLTRIYLRQGKPSGRIREIVELARLAGVPVRFEAPGVLEKRAGAGRHQGVVAELTDIEYQQLDELLARKPDLLLMIDGVEDPQNLGAVIRTAEAAGVGGVLLPSRHACGITAAVVKASAGAALHIPIVQIGNLVQTLEALAKEGFWSAGLDMHGPTAPWELDVTLPLVLVVGSEHQGLRRLVKEHCDFLVGLPMRGKVTSLNLSVASGILIYQILSQRIQSQDSTGEGRVF